VNLLWPQRTMCEQAFAQVREIAIGVSRRRHSLVHLDDVQTIHAFESLTKATAHEPACTLELAAYLRKHLAP
jgi:hypothetical protein